MELIPGLPDDVVVTKVVPGICWWDFAAARCINNSWRVTLDANHPLKRLGLEFSPSSSSSASASALCAELNIDMGERVKFGMLVLGHKVIVAGGEVPGECIALDRVDMFDLEGRVWESLPSLNFSVASCVMGVGCGNRILVLGGVETGNTFWVENAQSLGYGDHSWVDVEDKDIPQLIQEFTSFVGTKDRNVAMLGLESGGCASLLL